MLMGRGVAGGAFPEFLLALASREALLSFHGARTVLAPRAS
jgi:hypothetical protein